MAHDAVDDQVIPQATAEDTIAGSMESVDSRLDRSIQDGERGTTIRPLVTDISTGRVSVDYAR